MEISTKRYRPWELIYYEAYKSEKDARERERKLKKHGNAVRELKKRIDRSLKNGAGFIQHHFSGEKFNQAKTIKSGAGFTLVEMLVAMAIFVIVVAIISGLFVHAIQGQRRNLAYQELLDQTSYVMEYMSRSIRMAMKDDVRVWGEDGIDCLPDPDGLNYATSTVGDLSCLRFRNYKNECQYFCLDADQKKLVTATTTEFAAPTFIDLTSEILEVNSLDAQWVSLSGERDDSGSQSLVYIGLQVEGRERTILRIQTSISQRNLNTKKLP